jgi:hypothetical protein
VRLPRLNFVVLDANQLTLRDTISRLCAEHAASDQLVVLPWVHAFEQTKGEAAWFHQAHEHLRERPQAFAMAYPTALLQRFERDQLRAVKRGDLVDGRNTIGLRTYLGDRQKRPSADYDATKRHAHETFRDWNQHGWLEELIRSLGDDARLWKEIRRGLQHNDRAPIRDAVCRFARDHLARVLLNVGLTGHQLRAVASFPSFCTLIILAHVYISLRIGAQPPSSPEQLARQADNHAADVEAVLVSLYGKRLVSDDRHALAMADDMREIAAAL